MFKRKIAIINEETGEMKAYDTVKQSINNLDRYIVGVDGKYGIIDEKGNELCEIKYDVEMTHHYHGRFIVIENGKYGFIDLDGKEICNIEYENVKNFVDMCAPVMKNGKWGIIDSSGNILCDFKYAEIFYLTNSLWRVKNSDKLYCLLNEKFKEVTPFKYTFIETPQNNSDIIKVCIGFQNGFITRSGKEIIPVIYDYSFDFGVDYPIIVRKGYKWGIISRDGKVLVDFKYDYISIFDSNGYAEAVQYRETRTMKDTFKHIEWVDRVGNMYCIRPTCIG